MHKINNFNYETGSDDNLNENIIFLKCDNYSSLTFGNSFSYSNSQRSNTNKKYKNYNNNNNNNENTNNNINDINKNYLNKLKEENEALKKELKESNKQINLLKYKIQELKENNNPNMNHNNNNKISTRNTISSNYLRDKKNLKYDLSEDVNNDHVNNKKDYSFFGVNGKKKLKKDILVKINNTIDINNIYNKRKKIINIKQNFNLEKKNHKIAQSELYSGFLFDKLNEKFPEYISKVKI